MVGELWMWDAYNPDWLTLNPLSQGELSEKRRSWRTAA